MDLLLRKGNVIGAGGVSQAVQISPSQTLIRTGDGKTSIPTVVDAGGAQLFGFVWRGHTEFNQSFGAAESATKVLGAVEDLVDAKATPIAPECFYVKIPGINEEQDLYMYLRLRSEDKHIAPIPAGRWTMRNATGGALTPILFFREQDSDL